MSPNYHKINLINEAIKKQDVGEAVESINLLIEKDSMQQGLLEDALDEVPLTAESGIKSKIQFNQSFFLSASPEFLYKIQHKVKREALYELCEMLPNQTKILLLNKVLKATKLHVPLSTSIIRSGVQNPSSKVSDALQEAMETVDTAVDKIAVKTPKSSGTTIDNKAFLDLHPEDFNVILVQSSLKKESQGKLVDMLSSFPEEVVEQLQGHSQSAGNSGPRVDPEIFKQAIARSGAKELSQTMRRSGAGAAQEATAVVSTHTPARKPGREQVRRS